AWSSRRSTWWSPRGTWRRCRRSPPRSPSRPGRWASWSQAASPSPAARSDLTTRGLVLVALSGVVGYALPFWPYLAALRRLPVARAAAYLTLIPVCGLAGSVGFLRDQITWLDLVGAGLVVGPLLSDA